MLSKRSQLTNDQMRDQEIQKKTQEIEILHDRTFDLCATLIQQVKVSPPKSTATKRSLVQALGTVVSSYEVLERWLQEAEKFIVRS